MWGPGLTLLFPSPASVLRPPLFISQVWPAQQFRLNTCHAMAKGLGRWGSELTLVPSPLPPAGPGMAPTAPQILPFTRSQIPNSWCKPLPFLKEKKIILYCYLLFWHLGKPFSSYSSLQTWCFRRRKTALPWSQKGVAPSQRILPQGTFSLGQTDP